MIHNDFTQENALWVQIQQQTNCDKQSQQLLEMARLLLQQAQQTTPNPATLNSDDLTDLLLEYQSMGQMIHQFITLARPHLDPDYRGQPFEQELENLQGGLKQDDESLQSLKQQQQTLTQTQTHLQQTLEQQQALEQEIIRLAENIEKLKQELNYLQQRPARLTALADSSVQLQQEAQQALIESLPKIVQLIKNNQTIYRQHFNANQHIINTIQLNESLEEMSQPLQKIALLSQSTEKNLRTFDEQLQLIILIQEKQLQQLRSLREPSGA
ncbi:hypothetical protein BegalDRAFT_1312 [Beggiatoa alba B18LD]|uniref:Uncharacterized protein n=1 Tax=Beggiatoa alba B18LD TaxID=395493 RepID=I3CF15_9GAMM|nr:hypothetical protein [Beggiatoa alba]EIJ42208.1 hypothetical protein BegalDRAFT_1312 [Beggiatoa alba B18LD]